ncbi:MAG: hypothetical protein WD600_15225, partial [Pseudohongiella sp.]
MAEILLERDAAGQTQSVRPRAKIIHPSLQSGCSVKYCLKNPVLQIRCFCSLVFFVSLVLRLTLHQAGGRPGRCPAKNLFESGFCHHLRSFATITANPRLFKYLNDLFTSSLFVFPQSARILAVDSLLLISDKPFMYQPLVLFVGLRFVRARKKNQLMSFVSLISMLGIALGVLAL